MNEQEIIKKGKDFLDSEGIAYLDNPAIKKITEEIVHVIFLRPETLDPNIVIDPPDMIVAVNIKNGNTSEVYQM